MGTSRQSLASGVHAPWAPILAGALVAFLYTWLLCSALHNPTPHDIPLGVVAAVPVTSQVSTALESRAPDAFVVSPYSSAETAQAAVEGGTLVGALVVEPGRARILVAGAAGTAAVNAVQGALTAVAQNAGLQVTTEDVRPRPANDPMGVVPFFLLMGVTIAGLVYQILNNAAKGDAPDRGLGTLLGDTARAMLFALAAGLAAGLTVGIVMGFDSTFWGVMGTCALLAWAMAASTAALQRLLGTAGTAVAALVMVLGIASSGGIAGPRFLPGFFRLLSGALPPSAGRTAISGTMYYSGNGIGWSVGVLLIWIAASPAVLGAAALLRKRTSGNEAGVHRDREAAAAPEAFGATAGS